MNLLLALFMSLAPHAQAQTGSYKGYQAIDTAIQERLVDFEDPQIGLIQLFQFESGGFDFISLLGSYAGDENGIVSPPNQGELINATPNAFNVILWQVLFDNLASFIAIHCTNITTDLPMKIKNIQPQLTALCQWPLPAAKDEAVHQELFDTISGYEIPQKEFQAWYQNFVLSGNYDHERREIVIHDMIYTLLMNPYFLLKK